MNEWHFPSYSKIWEGVPCPVDACAPFVNVSVCSRIRNQYRFFQWCILFFSNSHCFVRMECSLSCLTLTSERNCEVFLLIQRHCVKMTMTPRTLYSKKVWGLLSYTVNNKENSLIGTVVSGVRRIFKATWKSLKIPLPMETETWKQ